MPSPYTINLDEIIRIENQFFANNYQGLSSQQHILSLPGSIPILVAAPHAVEHPRHSKAKKADALTGTIATQLHQLTGAHTLILAQSNGEDPNYDATGPFKTALAKSARQHDIKFILNLHGMARSQPWELVIGSNFGQSLGNNPHILTIAQETMRQHGFQKILVDDPQLFPAAGEHNLSSYSWKELGIPSFQIEVNRNFRDPLHHPTHYEQLINALINTIQAIHSALSAA